MKKLLLAATAGLTTFGITLERPEPTGPTLELGKPTRRRGHKLGRDYHSKPGTRPLWRHNIKGNRQVINTRP